jgi:hydrogenase 3 maturation protease
MSVNVLMGIGNTLRADDGAGPYLARTFHREGWISIDCSTMPENFAPVLRRERPSMVILVDAADMALAPGEFRRVPQDRIADVSIGTHQTSLTIFISYISSLVGEVVFIGIQPEALCDRPSLSPSVLQGVERLKTLLETRELFSIPCLL